MERKIIGFGKGIRRNPTVSGEGELLDCVNLAVKNGEIVNAGVMEKVGELQDETQKLLYIHHSTTGEDWNIVQEEYEDEEENRHLRIAAYKKGAQLSFMLFDIEDGDRVLDVTAMGNTLVISTEKSIYYSVYKDNGYIALGSHIPELELSFGLRTQIEVGCPSYKRLNSWETFPDMLEYNGNTVYLKGTWDNMNERIDKFHTAVGGVVNELHANAKKNKKFSSPFLVRYALKMYDGTYIMPSSPILMIPTSGLNPVIEWNRKDGRLVAEPYLATGILQMMGNEENISKFSKWKDIIKGVGVFVSAPFIKYNQSSNRWYNTEKLEDESENFIAGIKETSSRFGEFFDYSPQDQYSVSDYNGGEVYAKNYNLMRAPETDPTATRAYVPLPFKSDEQVLKEIKECAEFYKIKDFSIGEIPWRMEAIRMDEGTLENLTTMERLKDDSMSKFIISPNVMQVFNGRLHMGNLTKVLTDGFDPASMLSYTNGYIEGGIEPHKVTKDLQIDVYIDKNGTISKATSKKAKVSAYHEHIPKYIYYPDSKAYMCCLTYENAGKTQKQWLKMTAHAFMDGAVALTDVQRAAGTITPDGTEVDDSTVTGDGREVMQNKIYSSEVYNPFKIDSAQAKTVGEGEVLAMTSNVKALSQGQFGQYPMIAFTSEGIWSMEVDGEGKYSSARPLLRDVIIKGTKPLQTDYAVIYMTRRGLMQLTGSEAKNISENLDGMREESAGMIGAVERYKELADEDGRMFTELMNKDGAMLYDYANGNVRFYPDEGFSYVMDMQTGEWTKSSEKKPDAIVAGYPNSVAQVGAELFEYHKATDKETQRLGALITRETAFGEPMKRKTLMDLRVMRKKRTRGKAEAGTSGTEAEAGSTAKVAVWASNDRESWVQVKSLKGRSWIWYRFAVYADMTDVDGLEGIVCDVNVRMAGKMR